MSGTLRILAIVLASAIGMSAPRFANGADASSEGVKANQIQSEKSGEPDQEMMSGVSYAFTYQGKLNQNGNPITGNADFMFGIYDNPTGGLATAIFAPNVAVSNGTFTTLVDPGFPMTGQTVYLGVSVRFPAGSGNYVDLSPRVRLTGAPYAHGVTPGAQGIGPVGGPVLNLKNEGSGPGLTVTGTTANAIEGTATGGTATSGVFGRTTNPLGFGVFGQASGAGTAIEGFNPDPAGRAGNFEGTVRVGGSAYLDFGTQTRQMIHLYSALYGIGVQPYTQYSRCDYGAGFAWYQGGSHVDNFSDPGPGGTVLMRIDPAGILHTKMLEITGGADISEHFEISNDAAAGEIEPGTVVSISAEDPGELVVSAKSYDRRVAGIISGAGDVRPGLTLGQNGSIASGSHAVALSGRVYCKVETSNGPIEPGDLLTTSDVAGHAMKADPLQAQGAILGKAMTGLASGSGLVLVLVTLQ